MAKSFKNEANKNAGCLINVIAERVRGLHCWQIFLVNTKNLINKMSPVNAILTSLERSSQNWVPQTRGLLITIMAERIRPVIYQADALNYNFGLRCANKYSHTISKAYIFNTTTE